MTAVSPTGAISCFKCPCCAPSSTSRLDRKHPSCLLLRCPSARVLRHDRTPRRRIAHRSRRSVHPSRQTTAPHCRDQHAHPSHRKAARTPHPNRPHIPLRKSVRIPLRRVAPRPLRAAQRAATPTTREATSTSTTRAHMRPRRSAAHGTNPRDLSRTSTPSSATRSRWRVCRIVRSPWSVSLAAENLQFALSDLYNTPRSAAYAPIYGLPLSVRHVVPSTPPARLLSREVERIVGDDNAPHTTEIDTIPCAGLRIMHGPLKGLFAWRLVVRVDHSSSPAGEGLGAGSSHSAGTGFDSNSMTASSRRTSTSTAWSSSSARSRNTMRSSSANTDTPPRRHRRQLRSRHRISVHAGLAGDFACAGMRGRHAPRTNGCGDGAGRPDGVRGRAAGGGK